MKNPARVLFCLTVFAAALAAQQQKQPPARYTATEADKSQISAKMAELGALLPKLERNPLYADVAIYHKAAEFILKHPEEFATAAFVKDTLAALDTGMTRARELSAGSPSWVKAKGHVIRGFISSIDGSVQPYALSIPESYQGQPARLDIWMHGTDRNLNEVSFITRQSRGAAVPPDQKYIQMDVYGRSNVSYRWAGETDVFEAIRHTKEHYKIDPDRITARGHSMGGAGAWHLGLHHPDEWSAFEASAGYTETMVYAKKDPLPAYQQAALHYYDAVDYSLNGVNVPFVGYGGELDAQLQASKNIQAQLIKEGLNIGNMRAIFLIGPQTGHSWHPETHKVSERFVDEAVAKGRPAPSRIRFVTYTTRFNRCYWVTLEELGKHYERAEVDANREGGRTTVTTKNVARIKVEGTGALSLDGQDFPATGVFARTNGKWAKAGMPEGLHKRHGLQGPVDDAFMESFLCVRPTGSGTKATEYALTTLGTLQHDFSKWLRGEPRVKNDRDVTAADIANNNLILFGDPWSNSVIAKVIGKLPIQWTKEKITLGGKTVDAASYAPAMIYPNPLNPNKYVVINSGHTFSDSDWRGTNANLYPHIGDYALMSLSGDQIAHSGYFDERWK